MNWKTVKQFELKMIGTVVSMKLFLALFAVLVDRRPTIKCVMLYPKRKQNKKHANKHPNAKHTNKYPYSALVASGQQSATLGDINKAKPVNEKLNHK